LEKPEVATATKEVKPKVFTPKGRLSFPTWTAEEAYTRSQKGQYPAKDVASASGEFTLLLDAAQWEAVKAHVIDVFLPYCVDQSKRGEKKDALDANEVKALIAGLEGDLAAQTFNTPFKAVSDKTLALYPDAVAGIKCIGPKGGTIEQRAVVNDESELAVPDPDVLTFPLIKPIKGTVHELYPGCRAAATVQFYAYHNGKHPGFSAGVSTCVFLMDDERFGGGAGVDEDAIFMD
jgi:hypothetical protein